MKNMKKIISILAIVSIIATMFVLGGCGTKKTAKNTSIKMNSNAVEVKDKKDEDKVVADNTKATEQVNEKLLPKNKELLDLFFTFTPKNDKENVNKIVKQMLADDNKQAFIDGTDNCVKNNISENMTTSTLQSVNSEPLSDSMAKKYNKTGGYIGFTYVYQVGWKCTTDNTSGTDTVTIQWLVKDNDTVLLNFADKDN